MLSIIIEDVFDEVNCVVIMVYGMEVLVGGIDLICLGEMGIGNIIVVVVVFNGLFGGIVEDWIGWGIGVDDVGFVCKCEVVDKVVVCLNDEKDLLEILCKVGGWEIVVMVGLIIVVCL